MVNKDIFKGNWNQVKGKIKEKWGKLTDNELTEINGKRDVLLGKLQSKYGWAKDKAEKQLKEFETSFDESFEERETPTRPQDNRFR